MAEHERIVIVSGGSRGLGSAFVESLLKRNYRVYTFSRSRTPFLEKLISDPATKNFSWTQIDATDFAKVENWVRDIHQKEGRIDVLINNAAVAVEGVLTLMRPEDISSTLTLNLEGCIRLARVCAKYMLMAQGGVIINISSIIGSRGYSGLSVYGATKAGLDGFTRALARELGERGIRVNSVAPGYLETDMSESLSAQQRQQIVRRTPLGRLGGVNDVTGVINFLISDDARFITGQTLIVDGGITC